MGKIRYSGFVAEPVPESEPDNDGEMQKTCSLADLVAQLIAIPILVAFVGAILVGILFITGFFTTAAMCVFSEDARCFMDGNTPLGLATFWMLECRGVIGATIVAIVIWAFCRASKHW